MRKMCSDVFPPKKHFLRWCMQMYSLKSNDIFLEIRFEERTQRFNFHSEKCVATHKFFKIIFRNILVWLLHLQRNNQENLKWFSETLFLIWFNVSIMPCKARLASNSNLIFSDFPSYLSTDFKTSFGLSVYLLPAVCSFTSKLDFITFYFIFNNIIFSTIHQPDSVFGVVAVNWTSLCCGNCSVMKRKKGLTLTSSPVMKKILVAIALHNMLSSSLLQAWAFWALFPWILSQELYKKGFPK